MMRVKTRALTLGVVTAFLLSGCASPVPKPDMSDPVVASFIQQMFDAVNTINSYPPGATNSGYVLVSFQYDGGGKASNIGVRYSNVRDDRLDMAAKQAVEHAVFPAKPPQLKDIHTFIVRVEYSKAVAFPSP